ncbi:uncharacterized protein LOC112694257 [Sipha flava]|uniref:Uncharacterized protein LOC112694257 n=1 Tax=Sipha flava TaxID=143950 RepID=A0A8B8GT58_9HEMI|nr:uncharacterized protein LOC112694257 [Sipha flava]
MESIKNYLKINPTINSKIIYDKQKPMINVDHKRKESYQSELYEKEKNQMFIYLNNLITALLIEKERLINFTFDSNEKMNEFYNRTKLAGKIIDKLKYLINVEKSRFLLIDEMTKDNKKLEESKATVNWMEKSIYLVILRYNEIAKFLNIPTNDFYTEIKIETEPFQSTFVPKNVKQENLPQPIQLKDKSAMVSDLRSSIELLRSKIVNHGITPVYRLLGKVACDLRFIYNYSCTLFGMYVEGFGISKFEAKENAATEMLRSILKKQKFGTLSSHIRPFNKKELKTISPLIRSKKNYMATLENVCIKNNYPLPIYTLISSTKNGYNLEDKYSIRCNAIDFVVTVHSNKQLIAKQSAAQIILSLWGKKDE